MTHETLYRKYRPQKFSDVINQDDVVSLLRNSISEERISHAYIFAGSRGTGKTSVARILAKELGTTDDDLYEIDAASNRGIDDIRALRETIETLPFSSPKKVYLIDEAHMLTREAWNALLKTLEEPPKHVIFILATTELEKIPETIQSRCQICEFKKPTRVILSKVISKIAKKEGFEIEEESSDLISLIANGSFRDAIGALQKAMSSVASKVIKLIDTEKSLGTPRESLIEQFIISIGKKDVDGALKALKEAKENEMNMELFGRLTLEKVRDIILIKFSPTHEENLAHRYSEERVKFIKECASSKEMHWNGEVLRKLLLAVMESEKSFIPELSLELLAISLV